MKNGLTWVDRPNSYIGKALPRPSAKHLLTGRGRYVDDIHLPRMLHVAFYRSPHASARIASIDTSAALGAPGVKRIFTGEEIAAICSPWVGTLQHFPGMKSPPQHPLATARVSWVGEPIVAVVATSRALAEDAVERIEVIFDERDAVTDMDAALQPGAVRVHEEFADNIAFHLVLDSGDVDGAFKNADVVVEDELVFGRHTPVTMEPRSTIADFDPGERGLTVYQSTQTPYQFQDIFARHFGLNESRVRVIAPDLGGSFGMKLHTYPEDMAVVGISILMGRPIKYVADRSESFLNDIHARDHRVQASLAMTKDGAILGIRAHDRTGIGAYSTYPRTSAVEGNQVVRLIGAAYQVPAYHGVLDVVFQNKPQTSQYRAVGHPIAFAVTERLVDRAAARLGLDPFEVRRRNYIADEMFPYTTATGFKLERLSLMECLEKLQAFIDYPALRAEQAKLREQNIHRGIGLTTFVEITNPSPAFYGVGGAHISSQDGCTLKLTPSGEVNCAISICEQGQGTNTIVAQIVADQVGVSFDHVRVLSGDTEATPYGGANWGSRGAGIGGEVALRAARKLKANVLEIAGAILQSSASQFDIENGAIIERDTRSVRLTLGELATLAYFRSDTLPPDMSATLTVSEHYSPSSPFPFAFTNGIHASLVEVDIETGFVKLLKHWVVEDCGRIINPLLVDEQIRGGVVQGLGAALFEECLYNEAGQLLNGSMAEYLVPMACEMPDILIQHVETPTMGTLLGAKGVGEAGTAAASGAVLNAVNDAISPYGKTISQIPITPQRLLRALGVVR